MLDERRAAALPAEPAADGDGRGQACDDVAEDEEEAAAPSGDDRGDPSDPPVDRGDRSCATSRACSASRRAPCATTRSRASTIDLGDDLGLADPIDGHGPPHPDEPRPARRRAPRRRRSRGSAPAACAPSRCPLELEIDEEACRRSTSRRAGRVRLEDERARGARLTDHRELDMRAAVREAISLHEPIAPLCEPDCPGLCRSAACRSEPGHGHGEDDRPAARGAAGVPGRRRRRERVDSPLGPTSRGGASARPRARSQTTTDRRAGRAPAGTSKGAQTDMGVPEAKGLSRATGGAAEPPRPHPADARGMSALPRDEAAPPGLPELRLVQRPPGRRAQAGRRTSTAAEESA